MALNVTDASFKKEVLESEMPVLVDFWAEWCGPCQSVAPVVEAISNKYQDRLKVCKLNIDEAGDTASKYDVMSIPTLAVFKSGQIIDKVVGAVSEAALEATISKHI
ncbi:MAG: thioredoxin [Candidatus Orphnella occulta]|nr:thioredoxin [Candidatus Orphnella occulta]MDP8297321.1 thioredoxin [Candidatus Orphnella occulta]